MVALTIPNGMAIKNCSTVATSAMAKDIHMFSDMTCATGLPSYLKDMPKSPFARLPSQPK